jgi:hypothetical protein
MKRLPPQKVDYSNMDANPANPAFQDAQSFARTVAAEIKAPQEKRPLCRELPPPQPFPIDAMGPLKDVALAIHHATQAPLSMCAHSVLAAVTIACQGQRDVQLPGGGRKPLTGLFISIAESGERKSTVDRLAVAGIRRVEDQWRAAWESERAQYCNAKAAWDSARTDALRKVKGDMQARLSALNAIGIEPKVPPHPMMLIADPTPEALIMHLADGRAIAGLFTDEGGQLLGGAAFNDESRMRTAALLNILWDGAPIRRLRRSTGTTFLPGRRCSAHIMLQPIVADTLLGDSMADGIGLLARMLIVAPESTAGKRLFKEASRESEAALSAYHDRLAFLLLRPPVYQTDSPDALDPPVMQLNDDARAAWIAFYNDCEQAIAPEGPLAPIRAFAAKLAEHAGRLAAVLNLYHAPDAMNVQLAAMQCGIQLARFYANEMLRLHGSASVAPELRMAQILLRWWQLQPETMQYLAKLYQFGPNGLREAAKARAAVKILEDHGWIERLPPGIELDGKPRKEAWRLLP